MLKKQIIIFKTIFLLTSISASSDAFVEVENKGLVCLRNVDTTVPIYEIMWFKENNRMEWYDRDDLDTDGDEDTSEIIFSEALSEISSYITSEELIIIQFEGVYKNRKISIDRYSLQMRTKFSQKDFTSNCEVYSDKGDFYDEIMRLTEINKQIRRNRKI